MCLRLLLEVTKNVTDDIFYNWKASYKVKLLFLFINFFDIIF